MLPRGETHRLLYILGAYILAEHSVPFPIVRLCKLVEGHRRRLDCGRDEDLRDAVGAVEPLVNALVGVGRRAQLEPAILCFNIERAGQKRSAMTK